MNRFQSGKLAQAFRAAAVALTVAATANVSQAALVAYYPLDGDFTDVVGGFNGTPVNAPAFVASPLGLAAEFNGADQYATLTSGANLQLGGNFTVSAHVNFDVLSGDKTILGNDSGGTNEGLHLIARGNAPHMGFFANDTGGPGILTTGTWTHVAWQFEDGTQRMFVNGIQVASTDGHAAFAGTAKDVLMGRWNGGNYFDGQIDDVAIFNHVVTPQEMLYLANGGNATTLDQAPNIFIWDFRQGDLNDWQAINGPANFRSDDGGGIVADPPPGGPEGFHWDNPHANMVFRSPVFVFTGDTWDGVNVLSVDFAGGAGDQQNDGPSFLTPQEVIDFNGGQTNSLGEKAVAVLDLLSGEYVAWLFNPSDGAQGFVHLSLADFHNLGLDVNRQYALDFYENDAFSWGWTQMRQVYLAAENHIPEPTSALLGLIGVAAMGLRRRRVA